MHRLAIAFSKPGLTRQNPVRQPNLVFYGIARHGCHAGNQFQLNSHV
jgi:hypothetical protein